MGQLQSEVEATGTYLNRAYSYDGMGNRQSQSRNEPGTTSNPAVNTTFTTNPLNQISGQVDTLSTGPVTSNTTSFDYSGNPAKTTAFTGSGTGAVPTGSSDYTFNDQDRLEVILNKNATGTITGKSVFTYDGVGRKRITQEYTYDAGTGVYTKTSDIRLIYDGLDVIQERGGDNSVKAVYVRAGNIGGLLSRTKRATGQADVHLFYHYDGQGNVVQLTDVTQTTVAAYAYDAWGNSRGATGAEASANRFRFSSKEIHPPTGLYDYGLRFYNPGQGRFINRDPSAESGGLNLYAAVANNPVSFVDEYGLSLGSVVACFALGVWDGLMGGGMTFATAYLMSASVSVLMASCSPCIPAITAMVMTIALAFGIGSLVAEIADILRSNDCPEIKAYKLGLIVGDGLAGLAGGGLGKRMGPKTRGCFAAGTLVTMADGTRKPIEQVKAGDWVLAKDESTGQIERHKVENNTVRYVSETLLLTFSDGSKIETTGEHPLYVEGQGFLPAKEIGVGTSIVTRAGPALRITKIETPTTGKLVYNLTIEDVHTYFVGSSQVWVHNAGACGTPPRAKPGPKTDPNAPHNAKIRALVAELEAKGHTVLAGGRGKIPEAIFDTAGGYKNSRRPDILAIDPNGVQYGINVGRVNRFGAPILREWRALMDLTNLADLSMYYEPYYP